MYKAGNTVFIGNIGLVIGMGTIWEISLFTLIMCRKH